MVFDSDLAVCGIMVDPTRALVSQIDDFVLFVDYRCGCWSWQGGEEGIQGGLLFGKRMQFHNPRPAHKDQK